MKITLIDHYAHTPAEIATNLDGLLELLGENESHVFRCTCEEYDPPRGMYHYDDNSYSHHRDCPSGSLYHYEVLLAGLARYFREDCKMANDNTVSLPNAVEETQALKYARVRLKVCVVDSDALSNYLPELLRDDVRLVLSALGVVEAERDRLRAQLEEMCAACDNAGMRPSPAWGDSMVLLGRRYDWLGKYGYSDYVVERAGK